MIALLLLGFHRRYGKSYLLHWTLGFSALAIAHLGSGSALALARFGMEPLHPLRVAMSLIAGTAGFLQIGWLLFGTGSLQGFLFAGAMTAETLEQRLTATSAFEAPRARDSHPRLRA